MFNQPLLARYSPNSGRQGTLYVSTSRRIARLQAEKQRLEQELAKTRFVVDVQAKLHALLETLSGSADTDPRSTR